MPIYDFDVTVIDKNGKILKLKANDCTVKKSVAAWIGLKRVIKETIECDTFEYEFKEKKGKKKK